MRIRRSAPVDRRGPEAGPGPLPAEIPESTLILYERSEDAEGAYSSLQLLQRDSVPIFALAVMTSDGDGSLRTSGSRPRVMFASLGAVGGGAVGTLVGAVLVTPVLGLIAGGVIGAVVGDRRSTARPAETRAQLSQAVRAGRSAVALSATRSADEQLDGVLRRYPGVVVRAALA